MTTSLDAVFGEQADSTANTPSTETKETDVLDTASPADKAQDRDEKGRFKGKEEGAEEPKPEAEITTQNAEGATQESGHLDKADQGKADKAETGKPPEGFVPQGALHAARLKEREERQKRLQLEQELARYRAQPSATQPQQAAPQQVGADDVLAAFLGGPKEFLTQAIQEHLGPVQQSIISQQSEMWAAQTYGRDKVDGARLYAAELMDNEGPNSPALQILDARTRNSAHPFEELVKWHKEQALLAKAGGDLEGYIEAELQRRLAEQQPVLQQQPPAAQKPQNLPSSFASARNAGPRGGQGYGGPRPLNEILPQ